jgi:hypothetical protein
VRAQYALVANVDFAFVSNHCHRGFLLRQRLLRLSCSVETFAHDRWPYATVGPNLSLATPSMRGQKEGSILPPQTCAGSG